MDPSFGCQRAWAAPMPCGIAAGWSAANAAADHVACAFLCSAQAGYITGQNLLIDGGVFNGAF